MNKFEGGNTAKKVRKEIVARVSAEEGLNPNDVIQMGVTPSRATMRITWGMNNGVISKTYRPNVIAKMFGFTKGKFDRGCTVICNI